MNTKLPLPHFSELITSFFQHPVFLVVAGIVLLLILSSVFRIIRWILALLIAGSAGYGLYRLANAINHRGSTASSHSKKTFGWISVPVLQGNKVVHQPVLATIGFHNVGVIVVLLILGAALLIAVLAVRATGYPAAYVGSRFIKFFMAPGTLWRKEDMYIFPDVRIGTGIGESEPHLTDAGNKAGKKVLLEARDRFLNMGVIGPIGAGKTFMTMKPMIYQDLENIAKGVMANVLWISPQPEPSVERYAESLGITVRRIHIIDGQVDGKGTNIRFNPLSGSNIDAIISNVNILLNEQTGGKSKGDAFFAVMAEQATTDSLQLYKYLHGFDKDGNPVEIDIIGWFDTYLNNMNVLFEEAERVQFVAEQVEKTPDDDSPLMDKQANWIRQVVWPKLTVAERIMLKRAAASIVNHFGGNLDSKNAESYKNIIRGLNANVRVLISSAYVQELFGSGMEHTANRPNFSFESWIDPEEWQVPKFEKPEASGGFFARWKARRQFKRYVRESMEAWKAEAPHGRKGELLSVVTGQSQTGKLVGRMVLVFEQQAVLNRPGKDNDKPPVYEYVDEYPAYATESINEIRTQGRKHCHSMVMAHQSRGQMDDVARNYRRTMESSTRHWVYLSGLGYEDAKDVSDMCGKLKRIRTSKSSRQIRMAGLGRDDGGPLVTKSEQEELVPRFSPDFIQYEMTENEVLYIGVKNRRSQRPLRMRINEPQEDKGLIRKLSKEAVATEPKKKRVKRPEPISVYPRSELVAQVKWPLITIGSRTLFIYRWGMKVERDMYGAPHEPDVETEPTPPKLLKELFEESFFEDPPKQDTATEDVKARHRHTFGRAKREDREERDETEHREPKKWCPTDGAEMNRHEKGGSIFYKCPECNHIEKEKHATTS